MDKIDQFMTYLPVDFSDPSLVILKGHLLLEVALKDYISKRVHFPDRLDEGQIKFSSLVLFASSLEDSEKDRWLWKALKMANKIRNQIAHNLDNPKLSRSEKELIAYVQAYDGEFAVEADDKELPYRPLSLAFMQLFDCITSSTPAESDPVKAGENERVAEKMKAALKQAFEYAEQGVAHNKRLSPQK